MTRTRTLNVKSPNQPRHSIEDSSEIIHRSFQFYLETLEKAISIRENKRDSYPKKNFYVTHK